MRKTKKWVVLLLTAVMTLTVFSGCGETEEEKNSVSQDNQEQQNKEVVEENNDEENPYAEHVILRIFMPTKQTPDDEAVAEYINNLPQVQALNVSIEIVKQAGGYSEHKEKIPLLLATSEQMDIGFDDSSDFANRMVDGVYYDISEFLAEDEEFYDMLSEVFWTGVSYEGGIYGVPTNKEVAGEWAVYTESGFLEKYGIDPSSITDFQDLEQVMEACVEDERCPLLVRNYLRIIQFGLTDDYDFIDGRYYAAIKSDEGKTVINPFETEEFAELVNTMYEWNQKGYIDQNILTAESDEEQQAGRIGGIWGKKYAYGANLNKDEWETDGVLLSVAKAKITNEDVRGAIYGIYEKCENPERAYEFLKLWNTDSEVKNALYLGIPDVHYTVVDGQAQLVENKKELYDAENWTTGNNKICTPTATDMTDWESSDAFDAVADKNCDLGIVIDTQITETQQANVNAVMAEYLPGLMFGFKDPESGIAELNTQLKAAGIDEIIADFQTQYDAFLSSGN